MHVSCSRHLPLHEIIVLEAKKSQALWMHYLLGQTWQGGHLIFQANQDPVIFLRPHDPQKDLWEGPGIDENRPPKIAARFLPESAFLDYLEDLAPEKCWTPQDSHLPAHLPRYELGDLLKPLRNAKSDLELLKIQAAVDLSVLSHRAVMQHCDQAKYEMELEATFLYEGHRRGYRDLAYPPIVATGDRSTILHYHSQNRAIQDHDWLLIDAGWQHQGYCSDLTRSYPLNQKACGLRRSIYELVLSVHRAIQKQIGFGTSWAEIQQHAESLLAMGCQDLDLMKPDQSIKSYFPHRIGHALGLDVHDPEPASHWPLNFVFTLEPGLYFPKHEHLPESLQGFGVRIEDNFCLSADGLQCLSQHLPLDLDDIAQQ